MTEAEEQAYVEGSRVAWRQILEEALRQLGRDSEEWTRHRWIAERETVVSTLRRVCREHGDNDWPDNLHLSDIIEKHLEPHLGSPR